VTYPGPHDAWRSAQVAAPGGRAKNWKAAVAPAALVAGSLGGIAAIMAGLLTYLSPVDESAPYAAAPMPVPGGTADVQQVAQPVMLQPTVGPGGEGTPLLPAVPSAPPPAPAQPPVPAVQTVQSTRPTKIAIPAIGVVAPVGPVGLQKSGEVQVPPLSRPNLAGWYRLGPVPGELGPAVILGHVNNRKGAAVFNRLREVKRGHKIKVLRSDGKLIEFTVDGVEQIGKSVFPSGRVYGNVDTAALRLITCGGVYNPKLHSYTDNIIVYATLTAIRRQ
jgi:hypothetical protein